MRCAYNVDRRLATGQATSATSYGPLSHLDKKVLSQIMNTLFGARFKPMGRAETEKTLLGAGEGARGVIRGEPSSDKPEHLWNAVVHDNHVICMDAQSKHWGPGTKFTNHPKTFFALTGEVGDGAAFLDAFGAREFDRMQEVRRLKELPPAPSDAATGKANAKRGVQPGA